MTGQTGPSLAEDDALSAGCLAKWGWSRPRSLRRRFNDPFLRRAIPQMFAWPEIPMMAGLSLLAYMHNGNAGFPLAARWHLPGLSKSATWNWAGRSTTERRWRTSWWKTTRRWACACITTKRHRADRVISAAMGTARSSTCWVENTSTGKSSKLYDGHLPIHSQVQVSLGVNRDSRRAALGHPPAGPAAADRRRGALRDRRQALLLRPHPGAGGQIGRDGDAAHALRLLAAHLRPPAVRHRARSRWPIVLIDYLETIYPGLQEPRSR